MRIQTATTAGATRAVRLSDMARGSVPACRRRLPRVRGCARVVLTLIAVVTAEITAARAGDGLQITVVGGLGGVSQYRALEEPFWRDHIPKVLKGKLGVTIYPSDRSGLRGPEMLQLMRLGVVPFGTGLLGVVAGDEPELNAVDLPVLNPYFADLRRNTELFRSDIRRLLRDRYNIELLAIYTYPAQVLFCTRAFRGLDDLAGRRIRTSSVGQSEMMAAVGAIPVITTFASMTEAIRTNVVDCAITGTLSGNEVGLADLTGYIEPIAITWGVSFFGANLSAWQALPPEMRDILRVEIKALETAIWDAADHETAEGLACNLGSPSCPEARRKHMVLVPATEADERRRRQVLRDHVVSAWIARCGTSCATAWNDTLAASTGIKAASD